MMLTKWTPWLAVMLSCSLVSAQDTRPKEPKAAPSPTADAAVKKVQEYIAQQTEAKKVDKAKATWRTSLPKFPDGVQFTKGKKYLWKLRTNKGEITVRFLPDVAPNHVANFIYLTELQYFDGLSFHRVIPNFMAQGGCPIGNGRGGPGYRFAGEFKASVKHDRPGLLSMANAGPNTDGSQFFLTFVPTPWLDGKHTIFGEVTGGMDTLKTLEKAGSPGRGQPKEPLRIEKATVMVE